MAAPHPTDDDVRVPDEVLVDRIKNGDHEAFDDLYERYFKRIYAFVDKRLNNRADTEETVQEIFFNVFNSVGSYRQEAPFLAWIFGVSRRTIAARFKKKRHPMVSLHDEDSDRLPRDRENNLGSMPSPIESYEYNERIDTIDRLMRNRLTEEQRQLFNMHHIQEQPIEEIARMLCKSEDSIKSNLYRTRKILLAR